MRKTLEGSVAIVTGAAGGIGAAIARIFDAKEISCVLCDINEDGLSITAGLLKQQALQIRCDITNCGDIQNAIEDAHTHFGGIDILVNNAGIIVPSLFEHCTYDDMDR